MEDFQKKFVMALLGYAVQRNLDPQRLCVLSGIDYKLLSQQSKKPLTSGQINSLWKNACHLSNDVLFGLHFGESMQLAALGVVGQIVQTSDTVGQALTNACALTHLITDMFGMKIHHAKNNFKILITPHREKAMSYPFTYRQMADYLTVFIVLELKGLLLVNTVPLSVKFPYAITDLYEYSRIFNCPIFPRATELSLEFPIRFLKQPILSANYELQDFLLQKVNLLMKNKVATLQAKVYNYLLANSYLHTLSLEAVAANFDLSPRSLQRRLKEEGVTYLQIVEDVRRALATNYITSGFYSIKDITLTLGYNEQSAFLRAFKRWTGKTPKEYIISAQ